MIKNLEAEMPPAPGVFGIGLERHDWGSWWAQAKRVQLAFNSKPRYPTGKQRQAAWDKFNALRNEASQRANSERSQFVSKSTDLRDNIIGQCEGIGWSSVSDDIFFFDRTTADQMKRRSQYLRSAMEFLRDNKHKMLGEHKQECFQRFQEIKEEHELFWSQYKQALSTRSSHARQKIKDNLDKNRDRHSKTMEALSRQIDRADELKDKIRETDSVKWATIWAGWLS